MNPSLFYVLKLITNAFFHYFKTIWVQFIIEITNYCNSKIVHCEKLTWFFMVFIWYSI